MLIIFVVIIHNGISEKSFTERNISAIIPGYVEKVQSLIGIITAVAVPLFFTISGYLLYAKETAYIPVLKKKCRTLLLPYLVWNLLLVMFYFLLQNLPFTKGFFSADPENLIKNYGIMDWLDVFAGKFTEKRDYNSPFVYQFWFLRDLWILNLLFIGIKKLIDTFPLGIVVLCIVLWVHNIKIYVVSPEALLFFAFGYYIVKYNLGIKNIDAVKIMDLSIIYGITIILEGLFREPMLHKVNILLGCLFFLKISRYFIENKTLYGILSWLETYQFFVYAAHGVIMPQLFKIYIRIVPLKGVFILTGYFFMIVFGVSVTLVCRI